MKKRDTPIRTPDLCILPSASHHPQPQPNEQYPVLPGQDATRGSRIQLANRSESRFSHTDWITGVSAWSIPSSITSRAQHTHYHSPTSAPQQSVTKASKVWGCDLKVWGNVRCVNPCISSLSRVVVDIIDLTNSVRRGRISRHWSLAQVVGSRTVQGILGRSVSKFDTSTDSTDRHCKGDIVASRWRWENPLTNLSNSNPDSIQATLNSDQPCCSE